jgi:hypothetical protein
LRIDFFRGLALWWIFVDHIPTNWMRHLSLQTVSFCDAAELFVLLAGISAGLVYGSAMNRDGWSSAALRLLKRVPALYKAHVLLFAVLAAVVFGASALFDQTNFLRELTFYPLLASPARSIFEVLILRFQPGFVDVLPLYIVVLLLFVPGLPLLNKPRLLLVLSFALYLTARWLDLAPPFWIRGWTFNPLTWQFLFMVGAVVAHAPRCRPRGMFWDFLAGAVLVTCIALYHSRYTMPLLPQQMQLDVPDPDKDGLHPLRLVSILSMAWLAWRSIPANAAWLRSRWAQPVVLMGQHSLWVFCCGVPLSVIGAVCLTYQPGWGGHIAVNVSGAALLFTAAVISAKYSERASAPPALVSETARLDGRRIEERIARYRN